MNTFVCLTEESSATEMLKIILPKILPSGFEFQFIKFEGKQHLEKNIINRLKYWKKPHSYFLIMRDQDSGDCKKIKQELLEKVDKSSKKNCSIIRIACHELESFYLGDLQAVEKGFSIDNLTKKQKKKTFRYPDSLQNAKEELRKLTKNQYQPIDGSKKIAEHLLLNESNQSKSFRALIEGIQKLAKKRNNN